MGCLQSFSGGLRGSSMGSRISWGREGGVCSQVKLGATRSSHRRRCLAEIFIAGFVVRCHYLLVCLLGYLFIHLTTLKGNAGNFCFWNPYPGLWNREYSSRNPESHQPISPTKTGTSTWNSEL